MEKDNSLETTIKVRRATRRLARSVSAKTDETIDELIFRLLSKEDEAVSPQFDRMLTESRK